LSSINLSQPQQLYSPSIITIELSEGEALLPVELTYLFTALCPSPPKSYASIIEIGVSNCGKDGLTLFFISETLWIL
jgi:hypothetical protein